MTAPTSPPNCRPSPRRVAQPRRAEACAPRCRRSSLYREKSGSACFRPTRGDERHREKNVRNFRSKEPSTLQPRAVRDYATGAGGGATAAAGAAAAVAAAGSGTASHASCNRARVKLIAGSGRGLWAWAHPLCLDFRNRTVQVGHEHWRRDPESAERSERLVVVHDRGAALGRLAALPTARRGALALVRAEHHEVLIIALERLQHRATLAHYGGLRGGDRASQGLPPPPTPLCAHTPRLPQPH